MKALARGWQICLVALTLFAAPAQAQPRFAFDATPGQLSKDVVPSEYRLALDPDPAKETFGGVADIAIKVRRPVDAIVLNAFDLTAGEIVLDGPGGKRPMTATANKEKRQWRIADGRGIEPGEYASAGQRVACRHADARHNGETLVAARGRRHR